MSPYLSPKKAIAPSCSASALLVSKARTRGVRQRGAVGDALDLLDLLGRDRLVVREVEAQALRGDQRAGLLDVVAEHLAQGVVQQVRRGVVAPGRVAAGDVDGRRRQLARRRRSPSTSAPDVAAQVGQGERRVEDLDDAGLGADRAAVADLATALGIERRAVEEDLEEVLAAARPMPGRTASTRGLGDVVGVADERRRAELLDDLAVGVEVGVVAALLPGRLGPAALLAHLGLEARRRRRRRRARRRSPASARAGSRTCRGARTPSSRTAASMPLASSPSRIARPLRSVWRKRSSSLPSTPTMKSRWRATSG